MARFWTRVVGLGVALGALTSAPSAVAGEATDAAVGSRYVPVVLEKDGRATEAGLERMVSGVRVGLAGQGGPIVVMVHGFGQQLESSAKAYNAVAECLKEKSAALGNPAAVVGVHWDSDAGPLHKWMLKATGNRITSLLGMKKAVKNPYLEKSELAHEVGRSGLRSVLFRLQDQFPGAPVHCLAHSLGAQVVVSALAPEGGKQETRLPVVEPTRTLRLGMVSLVGADLDCDTFSRKDDLSRLALRRADVWWVTVPRKGEADGVLEMRKGAGKGDAVGNCGMKLQREDLDLLLSRRALVVDQKDIPASHALVKYLCEDRVDQIASSMLYLQDPANAAAQGCVLARLDRVLHGTEATTAQKDSDDCVKLYAAWKSQPQKLADFRFVHLSDPERETRGQALNRMEKAQPALGMQAAR